MLAGLDRTGAVVPVRGEGHPELSVITDMETVRSDPSVLHVDLDAFFAAVEQRDKPSLRGKPVVVGGVGVRGVVSTASYEARKYGVRSAMSTAEARSRCPHAAFLVRPVRRLPASQPGGDGGAAGALAAGRAAVAGRGVRRSGRGRTDRLTVDGRAGDRERLKAAIQEATGGLTASVGIGTSKLIAKIASDLDKPDGVVVVPPGTEPEFLAPMQVTVIPGVGPATAQRLRRRRPHGRGSAAAHEDELIRQVGSAHGSSLYRLALAPDDRAGGERSGDQVGQRRGHVRDRHHRPRRCWPRSATGCPQRLPSDCRKRSCPAAPSR